MKEIWGMYYDGELLFGLVPVGIIVVLTLFIVF
jgi:hypothetical protein